MEVLESNKIVLKQRYPKIWEALQAYMHGNNSGFGDDTCKMELVESREDSGALVVHKGKKTIRLNSQYYPLREVKQWVSQFEFNHISAHGILYGIGNGLFARELLANLTTDNSLFLIEPDFCVFSWIICKVDISDILSHERLVLLFYHQHKEQIQEILSSIITWSSISTLIRCLHPGYDKLYQKQYEEYNTMLEGFYEKARVSQNTYAFYAKTIIHNIINSLQYIKKSNYITEFIGQFPKEYPTVVVSAGPSLKKNIEMLRSIKDKAFILVVDTAVKVMEESGVPYDAIVLIDPKKPKDFITAYPGCKNKPLFCLTESQTEILDFHQGRKIWLPNSKWLEKTYAKFGLLFPQYVIGGSVATMATEVARIVGSKTIILVGQDLAYLGEQTHAGREKAMGEERGYKSQWVEGINGKQVRSRWDWIHFLHWFEEFITRNQDITMVDATEGGALIHGSKVMTLEDAINSYCHQSFSFTALLEKLPYTFEKYDFTLMKEEIIRLKTDTKYAVKIAKRGYDYLQEFYSIEKSSSAEELNTILTKCMEINEELATVSGYELIEIGSSEALRDPLTDINYLTGDDAVDRRNTAKMLEAYYQAVIDVSQDIIKEISLVIEKIDAEG